MTPMRNNDTTGPGQAPASVEAEEAVIGAVLVQPEAFLDVASFLQPDDFFIVRHAMIWAALGRISERNDTIDYLTVQEELRAHGQLSDIGGPVYLTQLINRTPTSTNAEVYGRLVERAALRRRMLVVADQIRALALDESVDAESAWLDGMQRYDQAQRRDQRFYLPGALSIRRYDETLDTLDRRIEAGEMVGYPLPEQWDKLREAIPMVYPGNMVVVSGAPGGGKSAFLETWAEWLASLGVPTLYLHTEMSTDDLLHRRMARHARIPFHVLTGQKRTLEIARRQLEADTKIAKFARHLNYHWMPDPKFRLLATELRRAAAQGIRAICLDHFQDVEPTGGNGDNAVRAIESAVTWLARFAEARQVLLIIASQQNKQGKTKWTTKLAEKGVVVLAIQRDVLQSEYAYSVHGETAEIVAERGQYSPVAEVAIQKARFGKLGRLKMLYHGPAFEWLDMGRVRRPNAAGKIVSLDDLKARAKSEAESEAR